MKTLEISFTIAFVLVVKLLFGQYSIDTIQVSAAQIPMKIGETGRSITVLDSDQINAMPLNSIDEILQTVNGIEIQSRGGFGVQADILMRGSTYTQVLIMIDGMRLNDPLTGHFNGNIPVTKSEIERIEILRGSAAAMYGADAVGGVINIITKAFSFRDSDDAVAASVDYGSHKYLEVEQGFFRKEKKFRYSAGVSIRSSEGEEIPEKLLADSSSLEGFNNYFDIKTFGFAASYAINDVWRLAGRVSYDHRDFSARYFYTTSPYDKSVETVDNWTNHLQLVRNGEKTSTDFNLSYKYNTDEFVFSPDFPSTNNHTTEYLNFIANHLMYLNDNWSFKGGLQLDKRMIESNDRGDHEDLHFGSYVMGSYRSTNLNYSLSLRADYDENYDLEFSPQINISYLLNDLILRASAGRSIRAADYTERFVSNNLQNLTPGRSLGNPDLLAENSWSYELGLDYKVSSSWRLSATAYLRKSSDLIDYVSTNESEIGSVSEIGSLQAGADYFFASNIANVDTKGFEISSEMSYPFGERTRLNWNISYNYNDSSNEEDIVSVYISSHARHLVSNLISLDHGRAQFSVNTLYKSRQGRIASGIDSALDDNYMIWNARASYSLNNSFAMNIQIQNLFDKEYQNILGAKMPGRWFMAGVSYKI